MKKELLAPAGDIEAGYAALYYGADAIYLGLQQFSARATATNFDEENLNQFVGYAHSLKRKVFAAVNTVVQESELSDLLKTLDICSRCHVDAVIIQDLGVARIIRETYPELEMHASTQMAVHNKEGALALQKLGFSRVVLARELSLSEIKEIAAIPGLETEAFIHGALCYSYSGLCLFSSLEAGRSANRGKCLYPCRAEFGGEAGKKHYFSMKDMALEKDVLNMPVTSLKIEGRKKTALYVAAVTDYYRRLLGGKDVANRAENIKQIFSRPWCKFHFNGRDKSVIERDFVGHRGLKIGKVERLGKRSIIFHTLSDIGRYDGIQIEIPGVEKPFGFSVQQLKENGRNVFAVQKGAETEIILLPQAPNMSKGFDIYLASSTKVKGAYDYTKPKPNEFKQKEAVDIVVDISQETIAASACGKSASVSGDFQKADQPQKVENAVIKAFEKSGDALVKPGNIIINNPAGLFAPASLLNELRRQLYLQLTPQYKSGSLPPTPSARAIKAPQWIIKTDNVSSLTEIDLQNVFEINILLSPDFDVSLLSVLPKNKVRLSLPAVCRNVELWRPLIDKLLSCGYAKWEIANYWGRAVLPESGIDLSLDAPIYMFNTQAIAMAHDLKASRITLPIEDTKENLQVVAEKSSLPVVLDIYADVPLFTSAACIRSNPCKICNRQEKWLELSREGTKYLALSKNCQTMLFDERSYCSVAFAKDIKADFLRVNFLYKPYTSAKAAEIWQKMRKFQALSNVNEGNLNRGVL